MARPKGTTKEVLVARKVAQRFVELKSEVNEDVMDAYKVIATTMKDTSATPATRKSCAETIISLYEKMYKDSLETLSEEPIPEESLSTPKQVGEEIKFSYRN